MKMNPFHTHTLILLSQNTRSLNSPPQGTHLRHETCHFPYLHVSSNTIHTRREPRKEQKTLNHYKSFSNYNYRRIMCSNAEKRGSFFNGKTTLFRKRLSKDVVVKTNKKYCLVEKEKEQGVFTDPAWCGASDGAWRCSGSKLVIIHMNMDKTWLQNCFARLRFPLRKKNVFLKLHVCSVQNRQ